MIKVAVVIPVWNRAATLGRAIESALMQKPDEIVVIDDSSDDNSVEVASGYDVKIVRHSAKTTNHIQALGPVYASLRSDYVVGMGADDVVYDGFLQNLRELLDARKVHSWPGVVFGDYVTLGEGEPLVTQEVRRFGFPGVICMSAEQSKAWFQSTPAGRLENGVGSAIRRDLLLWLHDEEYWRLGPWSDSMGYVVAAMKAGCMYVPQLHAGFVVQQAKPSYHQQALSDQTLRATYAEAAQDWLARPAVAPLVAGVEFAV